MQFDVFTGASTQEALDRLSEHGCGIAFIAEGMSEGAVRPKHDRAFKGGGVQGDASKDSDSLSDKGIQYVYLGSGAKVIEPSEESDQFLDDTFDSGDLKAAVGNAVMRILEWVRCPISVLGGNYIYLISPEEIRYVESDRRILHIHTANVVDTYATIAQFARLLPGHFLQCHKSYLVNLYFVKVFTGDRILLATGESIPVSQRKKRFVRNLILEFTKRL